MSNQTAVPVAGQAALTDAEADRLADAWDEEHGTSHGGCVYWPDCAEIGDHINPYRRHTKTCTQHHAGECTPPHPHQENIMADQTDAFSTEAGTRTPEEWCAETGVRILDPDGWRYDQKPWSEPITREEFTQRAAMSTAANASLLFPPVKVNADD